MKTLQDQVYAQIQTRLARICASEWEAAPKTKRGNLKRPLQYSATVDRLIDLSSQVLCSENSEAEAISAEITTGSAQNAFLNAKN
tara:strand:+ start:479 stop:733 length:255 start_codon:yes stop_codon:yes gene_type:complete